MPGLCLQEPLLNTLGSFMEQVEKGRNFLFIWVVGLDLGSYYSGACSLLNFEVL